MGFKGLSFGIFLEGLGLDRSPHYIRSFPPHEKDKKDKKDKKV